MRPSGELRILLGAQTDAGFVLLSVVVQDSGQVAEAVIPLTAAAEQVFVFDRNAPDVLVVTDVGVLDGQGDVLRAQSMSGFDDAVLTGNSGDWMIAGITDDGILETLDEEGEVQEHPLTGSCAPSMPMWYDVDRDGAADLMYLCDDELVVAHASGALHNGFPVRLPATGISRPVAGRTSQSTTAILVMTEGSGLAAIETDGSHTQLISGFPLPSGLRTGVAPLLGETALITLSGGGSLRAWEWALTEAIHASDTGLAHVSASTGSQPTGDNLLVASETYNWPNPVVDGRTRFRFQVRQVADVRIDIVDMSGALVDRLDIPSVAPGTPREVTWETSVGSGVYLARVRARSVSSSAEDTRLIRMAVIR